MKYCYLNGKIISQNKASIMLDDLGILRGYGVFDFIRTYRGKPFFLKEHLARLKKSAGILNIKMPVSEKELTRVIKKLLLKNRNKESYVRIVLTGGRQTANPTFNHPTLYILIEKLKECPKQLYKKGIKIIIHEHQRVFPEAKTLNYITAFQLTSWQRQNGGFEILYTSNGNVLEATTSNFFIIKKNHLITAKRNILFGITRNLIIKLAKKNKFVVEERDVKTKELKKCTEAFITATNKEIIPVVKIDNKTVGNGKVGKQTKKLIELFQEYIKAVAE